MGSFTPDLKMVTRATVTSHWYRTRCFYHINRLKIRVEAKIKTTFYGKQRIQEQDSRHFLYQWFSTLERVSIECRKSKTKVITLANKKGQRQPSKPIKTRSNYTWPTQSAGKCVTSDWLKKWRENFEPITEWSNAKPKQCANYFRHSIENRSMENTS